MWRFSMSIEQAAACERLGFLKARVTEDWEFSEAVNSFDDNEVVFAVHQPYPGNVTMAIEFIRGLCGHTPSRIWYDGEEIKA
jgi:hypothetical protein